VLEFVLLATGEGKQGSPPGRRLVGTATRMPRRVALGWITVIGRITSSAAPEGRE